MAIEQLLNDNNDEVCMCAVIALFSASAALTVDQVRGYVLTPSVMTRIMDLLLDQSNVVRHFVASALLDLMHGHVVHTFIFFSSSSHFSYCFLHIVCGAVHHEFMDILRNVGSTSNSGITLSRIIRLINDQSEPKLVIVGLDLLIEYARS